MRSTEPPRSASAARSADQTVRDCVEVAVDDGGLGRRGISDLDPSGSSDVERAADVPGPAEVHTKARVIEAMLGANRTMR